MTSCVNLDKCLGPGIPSLQDLMPDDLSWSWCHNNRNKVHSKCNVLESSQNRLRGRPRDCWKTLYRWRQISTKPKIRWAPSPITFFQASALSQTTDCLTTWGTLNLQSYHFCFLLAIFPKALSGNDVTTVWLGDVQGHKHSNKIKAASFSQNSHSTSTSLGSLLFH